CMVATVFVWCTTYPVASPKATWEAMNQPQAMRALSAGLISLSVAHTSADHKTGAIRRPQQDARRHGRLGSSTAKSRPTRRETAPWLSTATPKAVPLKACNCARSACAIDGSATAASRLIGYQML